MYFAKWRPFCLGLNVLSVCDIIGTEISQTVLDDTSRLARQCANLINWSRLVARGVITSSLSIP